MTVLESSSFVSGTAASVPARSLNRITVVHVLHTMAYGGVETIIINWLRAVDRQRFDVHLVVFANPGATEAPFVEAAQRAGFAVRTIPWSRWKPVFRATRALVRILREVNADVVHTYNVYADLVGLLAARIVGARVLTTLFVWSDFGWKRNFLQHVDRWVLHTFDLITAQCEKTRQDTIARGLPAARTKVLISGFPPPPDLPDADERQRRRRAMGIEDGRIVLANVARLYPEKAQDVLLRSFAALRARHPEAELWIFGTGPLEAPLRALSRELGVDPHVRFLGFIDAPLEHLPLLDIQVHPSHAEGVPLALCEGLAAGLPIIASSVGGVPEVLDGGGCGILLPPAGDAAFPELFVAAASRLIVDRGERARLGAAGRRFISTSYSVQTAAAHLERTYTELVETCASVSS